MKVMRSGHAKFQHSLHPGPLRIGNNPVYCFESDETSGHVGT